ncbi:nucleotide sugar dehydrogenase [Kiloniella laminariae]|uniref:Nucleotide sugar dehydrogenase n=1 Tax=Kiloniella laminariae TaxID=454162 RepID=A0ABT4LI16_9PROT|nr:nucleotide sugar dehydrogenase [Kiloniella laminariae]MCZ4280745.1 nucleotide sugar dehydrogenase [Kiloniella laminariae]
MSDIPQITIVGLGYVGLPLAINLAKYYRVTGFDIDEDRIKKLKEGYDKTGEVTSQDLRNSTLHLTSRQEELHDHDIHIVTVPTPVDSNNQPDLTPVRKASETVGTVLKPGNIIVYESTVYPGVTEDICGPILAEISGLECGKDFFLGYSPERINPGDREHTVDRITKVVAGQTNDVAERLRKIYGTMNNGNIFLAKDIKTAEAAKVIENAQRDINIAFVNEIAVIFQNLGISVYDVLEAAGTKWNFLNFQPGLVGGHCIGVDPYYLAHCAKSFGHDPKVILSGRSTNEAMSDAVSNAIHLALKRKTPDIKSPKTLIMGLTFKEDVPDLRNTKVTDIISALTLLGHQVEVHDPMADPVEAEKFFNITLKTSLESEEPYDCIIGAVPHAGYLELTNSSIEQLVKPNGLIADMKGMWRKRDFTSSFSYWCL